MKLTDKILVSTFGFLLAAILIAMISVRGELMALAQSVS